MNKLAYASLLDAVADHLESLTATSYRQKIAQRDERISTYASLYERRTGADLPKEMREKLSSMDEDLLEHFLKSANTDVGSPDSLGGPTDDLPSKTAMANAGDALLAFCNGNSNG